MTKMTTDERDDLKMWARLHVRGGYEPLEEIEEILSKDSRYHVLEVLNDDRADLLMEYLEELERRGPPPPPTASEPNRRK